MAYRNILVYDNHKYQSGKNGKTVMENSLTGQDVGKYKIGPLLGVGGLFGGRVS